MSPQLVRGGRSGVGGVLYEALASSRSARDGEEYVGMRQIPSGGLDSAVLRVVSQTLDHVFALWRGAAAKANILECPKSWR